MAAVDDLALAAELFREPILCAAVAGAVLGWLGVFVVLRRMVFVSAAVTQAAGLGVALAFYAQIHLGAAVPPIVGAVGVAGLVTAVFGLPLERTGVTREAVLGFVYLVASAAAIAVGSRISQESHDIVAILFGSAVLVRTADVWLVTGVSVGVAAALAVVRRGLVFASFDRDGAAVNGLPVALLDLTLWLLLAIEVAVATRALGALPVFAFSVLPATAALLLAPDARVAFGIAMAIGAVSGSVGYVAAFFLDLPVGAAQALTAAAFVAVGFGRSMLGRR